MRKLYTTLFLILSLFASDAFAQMTDEQIIEYIREADEAGKDESQIGKELLAKGVSVNQVQQLKTKYESSDRGEIEESEVVGGNPRTYARQAVSVKLEAPADRSGIFGHSVFNNKDLSFEPNENSATPSNYRLGPGDEVIVELWGSNEAVIRRTISPEGNISVSQVGQIQLSGLTIKEATSKMKKVLAAKYQNVSNLTITLGAIRTIQVNVMGEVYVPGTYRLSSFSTVFNALYRAGGVSESGSLRNVTVLRNGKKAGSSDIYNFIFNGTADMDFALEDGDVIMVPAYEKLVTVSGAVKRPMRYEMTGDETLADALSFAGGFSGEAYRDVVSIERAGAKGTVTLSANEDEFAACLLADGDVVTVMFSTDRKDSGLNIDGYVFQPGNYEFGPEIGTVGALVKAAGGVLEDAFLNRAILSRRNEDMSIRNIPVDLGGILSGNVPDVALEKNDKLYVAGKFEINKRGHFSINGLVSNPGVYDFADNTTLEDFIVIAGGLLPGASMARVDVVRRKSDSHSITTENEIAETFSFEIKDGLVVDSSEKFYLEPFDIVSVRKAPTFEDAVVVTVSGQVAFPGKYVLINRNERLSDIIKRAGGVTDKAYVKGAVLIRKADQDDSSKIDAVMRMADRSNSVNRDSILLNLNSNRYTVGIRFDNALAHPGSQDDIILKHGDVLNVPDYDGTVRINGEVLCPNTVVYVKGNGLNYYINQAGGYNDRAKKSKVYIVYQNGRVSKASSGKIEPGCEIIVPTKPKKKEMSAGEVLSLSSSAASLATMVATLVNIISR